MKQIIIRVLIIIILPLALWWLIESTSIFWEHVKIWSKPGSTLAISYLISKTIFYFAKLSLVFLALYLTNRFWYPDN